MSNKLVGQFIRYAFVGGLGAIVEWVVLAILLSFQIHYLVGVSISLIIAATVNYALSAKFVFIRGKHSFKKEATLLYAVTAMGFFLNLLLMYILVEKFEILVMPAKIATTGIVFFWNFIARKIWVFME
jgi:putative flippase GtrA